MHELMNGICSGFQTLGANFMLNSTFEKGKVPDNTPLHFSSYYGHPEITIGWTEYPILTPGFPSVRSQVGGIQVVTTSPPRTSLQTSKPSCCLHLMNLAPRTFLVCTSTSAHPWFSITTHPFPRHFHLPPTLAQSRTGTAFP